MPAKEWIEYVVTEQDEGMTVEEIIRQKLAVSGRMLQRLTRSKGIRLNRKMPYLKRPVKLGDRVAVRIADRGAANGKAAREALKTPSGRPEHLSAAPDVETLYEDEYYLVANKPSGLMVHAVRKTRQAALVDVLAVRFRAQGQPIVPHLVHRLDKETSGAVLIAKSSYAHQLAARMMNRGNLHREYLAIVCGCMQEESGTIRAAIKRDGLHPTRRKVSGTGEPAVTHYRVLAIGTDTTLVKVWLETGKTHQIRVHFAHHGHPLVGDGLYGGKCSCFHRQALHAFRLSFPHPLTGELVTATAPLPDDLRSYLRKCGYDVEE
ncbi:MAG: RluA family pseudouridine synthase [Brevibacillus sp.]|nr:RluA family pseudouridine synthase [Brevibacillus sp.]